MLSKHNDMRLYFLYTPAVLQAAAFLAFLVYGRVNAPTEFMTQEIEQDVKYPQPGDYFNPALVKIHHR